MLSQPPNPSVNWTCLRQAGYLERQHAEEMNDVLRVRRHRYCDVRDNDDSRNWRIRKMGFFARAINSLAPGVVAVFSYSIETLLAAMLAAPAYEIWFAIHIAAVLNTDALQQASLASRRPLARR
jgi:hypothetical protein